MLFRRLRALLVAVLLVLGFATAADADHLRTLTVRQIASDGAGTVTVRAEFNYSGNCCGGAFQWTIGESPDRTGVVPDGIVNGAYTTDQPVTPGTFSDGSEFYWSRLRTNPSTNLVQIDITWKYYTPVQPSYTMRWSNCCPQSNNELTIRTGAINPKIILAPDTGNASLANAFGTANIPACPTIGGGTPPPVCYELAPPAVLAGNISGYSAIVIGSNMSTGLHTALGLAEANLHNWLTTSPRGIAVFGQNSASWSWLPTGGQPDVVGAGLLANDVTVTPAGMLHTSHLNQLPTVGPLPGTLANWNVSAVNHFTAYPTYFTGPFGTALAQTAGGQVVGLAGLYAGTPSCQVITGQPVDDRAANVFAAQQLFRAMLEYAIACVDPARQ